MPGAQGPKTVKGPKVTRIIISRLLLDCVPVFHKIITPFLAGRYLLFRNLFLILWFRSYSDVIIDVIARSECLPGGRQKNLVTPLNLETVIIIQV